MKLDLESLSAEPLVYMLMHSGAFVAVLGAVFFIIGLLFGYATWGRYKRQTRELRGEAAAMKDEIAQLKRKVGDHSVKSGPAVVIATETIHMPRKEGEAPAAPPVVAEEPSTAQTSRPSTKNRLQRPRGNVIKAKTTTKSETTKNNEPPASSASLPLITADLPPPPARHASPLASIIATTPPVKAENDKPSEAVSNGLVPLDVIPALTELPAIPSLPAVGVMPELDPMLGPVYKTRPEHCDDLTALKGIATVLEERLHTFGIYTYAQIAAWNDDHIREFSSRLAFKDRIQREHWVEQARQLVAKNVAQAA